MATRICSLGAPSQASLVGGQPQTKATDKVIAWSEPDDSSLLLVHPLGPPVASALAATIQAAPDEHLDSMDVVCGAASQEGCLGASKARPGCQLGF